MLGHLGVGFRLVFQYWHFWALPGGGQVTACGYEGREDSELEVSSPNYCFTFSPSDPEAAQHQRDHDIALCNCGAQTYQIRGFSIFGNRALHPRFSY